jgi:hypothetical protein
MLSQSIYISSVKKNKKRGGQRRGKQHNGTEEDILESLNDTKNGQSINALRSKTSITVCH